MTVENKTFVWVNGKAAAAKAGFDFIPAVQLCYGSVEIRLPYDIPEVRVLQMQTGGGYPTFNDDNLSLI